jgi:DNA mismatch endonuclease (patch repair protein)
LRHCRQALAAKLTAIVVCFARNPQRVIELTDTLTPRERSRRMAAVRSIDTKPEFAVRRLVHGMGYRYRLHRRDLPGTPDLVFPARRAVVFVHGCFWHRHEGCALARIPKSRVRFWTQKLEGNRQRDARALKALRAAGWRALVVWECELKKPSTLARRLRRFLDRT